MYVGRFVVIAPSVGAYRVSSRSFPDRHIVTRDGTLTVEPTPEAPATENPYISYNCVQRVGDRAVLGNGSHVDPIAEKLALGYPGRDALATGLLALDYEKDDYDTPRIAGIVGDPAVIGIVRRDALLVETVDAPTMVATYERDTPTGITFEAATAEAAARRAYDLEFEHAVCAAAVTASGDGVELAVYNGPEH